jgi:hypothetical protein
MWSTDPKDKGIYKYKHEHTHTRVYMYICIYEKFSVVELFEDNFTGGGRRKENNIEMLCICVGRRQSEAH